MPSTSVAFIDFTSTSEVAVLALVLYLLLVFFGRLLKRKLGTRLELSFQIFCVALATWLPLARLWPGKSPTTELGALTALFGTMAFAVLLDQYLWGRYFEQHRGTQIPKVVRQMVGVVLLLVVLLFILDHAYGVQIPGLLAGSGIIAVILGLAMQESLGNVVAGFMLQIGRPFQPGDWVLLDNQHVRAVEINWRSSRFINNDDVQFDMPNQQIIKQTIVNYHGGGALHGMRLEIGIDYDASPNLVKDVLARAAAHAQGVAASPAPNVFLKNFGDSAIIYEVRFWLDDHRNYTSTSDIVRTNIWYALKRHQIKIPYPIRVLQIERGHKQAVASGVEEQRKSTLEILRQQPLFLGVLDPHLEDVIEQSIFQHYGRGEVILREGADGASMFVLIRGEAAVTVGAGGQSTRVAVLKGGECFGEMSLLTGAQRSANIIAMQDCEVLEIIKPVFAELMQRETELLPRLSELLAHRQMETEGIIQAKAQPAGLIVSKEQEYKAGFLKKLRSFFEL